MDDNRYAVISDILTEELAGLPHGTRVASENELCARFGVSRSTVRSALGELESRLVVRRVRGGGTYVNRRLDYLISRQVRPSWHQSIVRAGRTPKRILLDTRVVPATERLAEIFSIEPGTPVTQLTTSNYIDDLMSTYGTTWVPQSVAPDLVSTTRVYESVEALLRESWKRDPVADSCRVSFDYPDTAVRTALEMNRRGMAWNVIRSTRDGADGADGPIIMASDSWFRPDSVRIIVEL